MILILYILLKVILNNDNFFQKIVVAIFLFYFLSFIFRFFDSRKNSIKGDTWNDKLRACRVFLMSN